MRCAAALHERVQLPLTRAHKMDSLNKELFNRKVTSDGHQAIAQRVVLGKPTEMGIKMGSEVNSREAVMDYCSSPRLPGPVWRPRGSGAG